MREYTLILKSHCDVPDYEDTEIAPSKMQAAKRLQARANFMAEDPLDLPTILANMVEGQK